MYARLTDINIQADVLYFYRYLTFIYFRQKFFKFPRYSCSTVLFCLTDSGRNAVILLYDAVTRQLPWGNAVPWRWFLTLEQHPAPRSLFLPQRFTGHFQTNFRHRRIAGAWHFAVVVCKPFFAAYCHLSIARSRRRRISGLLTISQNQENITKRISSKQIGLCNRMSLTQQGIKGTLTEKEKLVKHPIL